VVDLESLLLVATEPQRAWRAEDLAHRLYISDVAARSQLKKLQVQGFLHPKKDGLHYEPPEEFAEAVKELARAYETMRVRIIEYIYSRPAEGVYGFARAFRIKGDHEE
jgi:DNA-binding IclR family transcriptional regulator